MSGGRDLWSPPLVSVPDDPVHASWEALNEVLDPELPIGLVDLGLIYDMAVQDRVAIVDLTFTATACPCMEFIKEDIRDRLLQEAWLDEVRIRDVWDPPWTTDRVTSEGRRRLAELGVTVG